MQDDKSSAESTDAVEAEQEVKRIENLLRYVDPNIAATMLCSLANLRRYIQESARAK